METASRRLRPELLPLELGLFAAIFWAAWVADLPLISSFTSLPVENALRSASCSSGSFIAFTTIGRTVSTITVARSATAPALLAVFMSTPPSTYRPGWAAPRERRSCHRTIARPCGCIRRPITTLRRLITTQL